LEKRDHCLPYRGEEEKGPTRGGDKCLWTKVRVTFIWKKSFQESGSNAAFPESASENRLGEGVKVAVYVPAFQLKDEEREKG